MRFSEAETHFHEISTKFPNIWADLFACQSKIQNVILQHVLIVQLNKEVQDALEKEMRKYLHFLFVLSGCEKSFETTYWDIFLLAASSFEREHFLSLMEECPANLKESNAFVKANYDNMLDNSVVFDISRFLDFCDAIKDSRLFLHHLAIQYDSKNYDKILEALKGREFFLKTSITILDIYIQSLIEAGGVDEALETLHSLKDHYGQAFDYLVLEANLLVIKNDVDAERVLSQAFELALEPGFERISLSGISKLAMILKERDRFDDAIKTLNKYCKQSSPLLFDKLLMLMTKDAYKEECALIIEQLINDGFCHPLVYQYRGALKENQMVGTGLADFEKSFEINPSYQSAYSILVSRIRVQDNKDDAVLAFAARSESAQLLSVVAEVYKNLKMSYQESFYALKALLLTGDVYDKRIYGYFATNCIMAKNNPKIELTSVTENSVVKLTNPDTGASVSICFHKEVNILPISESNFANCIHTSCSTPDFLRMKFKKVNEYILWDGSKYIIDSIEDRTSCFVKYCFNSLIIHQDVISIYANKADDMIKQITQFEIERNNNIESCLDYYETSKGSTPISLLASQFGKTDYETIRYLLLSSREYFAGVFEEEYSNAYILTLSTLYILEIIGVQTFDTFTKGKLNIPHFVYKKLQNEIEKMKEDADRIDGVIWAEAGTPRYLRYTDELRSDMNNRIANLSTLVLDIKVLDALDTEFYVSDFADIYDSIGRDNYEAISYAKKYDLTLLTDDLCVRSLAFSCGVKAVNCIDVLIQLEYGYIEIIRKIQMLLEMKYRFPVTVSFLKYLSNQLDVLIASSSPLDSILESIDSICKLIHENQIFWMDFLNQTSIFYKLKITHNEKLVEVLNLTFFKIASAINTLNPIPTIPIEEYPIEIE